MANGMNLQYDQQTEAQGHPLIGQRLQEQSTSKSAGRLFPRNDGEAMPMSQRDCLTRPE